MASKLLRLDAPNSTCGESHVFIFPISKKILDHALKTNNGHGHEVVYAHINSSEYFGAGGQCVCEHSKSYKRDIFSGRQYASAQKRWAAIPLGQGPRRVNVLLST